MRFTSADISVIIPSYNSRQTIRACLASLLGQEAPPGEVIVVDSSSDDTLRIVASEFPQVRIHHFNNPTFPGPARNRGAGLAGGTILAFLDADCIPAPDWTQRILQAHRRGHLAAGGAIQLANPGSRVAWAGHILEFRQFVPVGPARPVEHIPTCNISYRRDCFMQAGGFPSAYYPQEDLLFNYALARKGVKIWFDPEMRVRHTARDKLGLFLSHQHRIGRVTFSTLRRIRMPGSALARRSWLAWLAAPLVGLVKFGRALAAFILVRRQYGVCLASQLAPAPRPLELLPVLLVGSLWWMRGFAAGAWAGLSGVRGRRDPDEAIFEVLSESKVLENHPNT